jgi:hypothetical protein
MHVIAAVALNGFLALRGVNATGPDSWLAGDWGKLEAGGDRTELFGTAHLGAEWSSEHFTLHVSGAARSDAAGEQAGLIDAYAEGRASFGLDELQVRAGQFFLPTSRENRDPLWASPYTVNFSALNSWIGEEVRPLGVDLQYRHITGAGHALTGGATVFRGNDSMGALLAWRGWAIGNRLSAYDEVLPLPPVPTLQTYFAAQRDDGTKPFGTDLDGNTGWSARLRWSVPQRAGLQYLYLDNQGDRALHRGEYAWATKFHLIGADVGDPDRLSAAAEYMTGKTGMGHAPAFVDADFYATYVLLSWKHGRQRFTGRYELFNTEERDFSVAERNEENGRSWTFTWMLEVREHLRVAAELTQVTGDRADSPDPDGRTVTLEARYTLP